MIIGNHEFKIQNRQKFSEFICLIRDTQLQKNNLNNGKTT
jgi:hypothetical protein